MISFQNPLSNFPSANPNAIDRVSRHISAQLKLKFNRKLHPASRRDRVDRPAKAWCLEQADGDAVVGSVDDVEDVGSEGEPGCVEFELFDD